MIGLPIAFAAPAVLAALVLLPVIWWLLRITPPRPRQETFPPTRLLLEIAPKEETPNKSPWWLTALRLLIAALVIIALAGPILRPAADAAPGSGPLLVVLDNGWASASKWKAMVDTAKRLIARAGDEDRPVTLVATAEDEKQQLEPANAAVALKHLEALTPRPWPSARAMLAPELGTVAGQASYGGAAWLTDGLGGPDADRFVEFLNNTIRAPVVAYDDSQAGVTGVKPPLTDLDAMRVPVIRRDAAHPAAGLVRASDLQGRVIGEASYNFAAGATSTEAALTLPVELRNDIVRVEIAGEHSAGAVQLLDERFRRRLIGLLSGESSDISQPLLSPLYYITRAVQPFADVREPLDASLATAIPQLINAGVSALVLADIGTMTPDIEEALSKWVEGGGTLIRFAGPRLAAAEETLTPVTLRHGDRTLGGSLSWETPQSLASFSADGPFAGLKVPTDIVVTRQVLAEPDGDLGQRTWAALADGTPLITGRAMGKGLLVLFHVTANTTWSNLPLSGSFVEMLRRVVAFSTAPARAKADAAASTAPALLPPYRLIDGYGRFAPPGTEAPPLPADAADAAATHEHPPGLFGAEDGFRAVNLLTSDSQLLPTDLTKLNNATRLAYPSEAPTAVGPYLLGAALALLLLDALAVLWLAGALQPRRVATAAVLIAAGGLWLAISSQSLRADEAADRFAMDAEGETHLAYVLTGNASVDEISRAGLDGLSRVLAERTALEPGKPIGVDPARDELAFFPLLYWPIDPDGEMPSAATMARVDAYMKQGGSVLFDTRDELDRSTGVTGFTGTTAGERLQAMLANLDIPPLEPVPADHVLTKAFYLLNDFPGRYAGGALWVEASSPDEGPSNRPARAGDGVTTILITENDFASAWAVDDNGAYLFPTVPSDPLQRERAYRTGINIVMYTLTGNYKADQVHVPALLERLGQ